MHISLKPLARQVMLITGASSGIGLATARAAAARGAKVMLVARNAEALEQIVREIGAAGGQADFAVADVADPQALRAAADRAIARWGGIDTWVNDAGVAIYARLADTPLDEHERLFRTNYFGVVNGATIAIDLLRARGGALITVGSIASQIPSPILGAYSASKHAVRGYIDSLRIEARADRLPVSITLIKPAGIDTPIGAHAANHVDGEALIPPPVYDPDLVAEAILDAAVHPRREVTVGGAGMAQILLATHFPALLDRLGGLMIPALSDRTVPKTPGDSLDGPGRDGRERSAIQQGRRSSLYTAAMRHKPVLGVAALVLGAMGYAAARMRRPATPRSPRPAGRSAGEAARSAP